MQDLNFYVKFDVGGVTGKCLLKGAHHIVLSSGLRIRNGKYVSLLPHILGL